MKAVLAGTIIAEADQSDLVRIEGNWYFPPASVAPGVLVESSRQYMCPWKGAAQYFSVQTDEALHEDYAWSYPTPYPSAFDRVGTDFSGYVAFDPRVEVSS